MAKKPANRRAPQAAQPTAAQLKSIDRLLETRRYEQAIERLPKLIERFPEHNGLRLALIEAFESARNERAAAATALDWAMARPRSRRAQETLLMYAVRFFHAGLAERTARQLRDLGVEAPDFLPSTKDNAETFIPMPDGTQASLAEIARLDIGMIYLQAQRFEEALEWFEDLDLLSGRNNHGFALYHLERIDEALDVFMAAWQQDADNLIALSWGARLRLYRGDEVGALGLCTPLSSATARRDEDALSQISNLLFLGQDEAAWNAFERARRADWFGDLQPSYEAQLLHFGACAASRLQRLDEARRLWRQARTASPEQRLAKENLDRLDQEPDGYAFPMLFDTFLGLPLGYVARLREEAKVQAGKPGSEDRMTEIGATNRYLDLLYRTSNAQLRKLIEIVLKDRVEQGDSEAAEVLKGCIRVPIGTFDDRMNIANFLREQKQMPADASIMIWQQGECRELKLLSTEIYREAAPSTLPPKLEDDYADAVMRYRDGDYAGAERLWRAMLKQVPDHPMVLGNLASACLMQGREEEGRSLLHQAIDKNPDYLFGRCNLANLYIESGELDEAQRLLDGLHERPRLHVQEAFALYGSMAKLKQTQGDPESAQKFIRFLEAIVGDEDDERRLLQIKRSIEPNLMDREVELAMSKLLARIQKLKPRTKSPAQSTSKPRKRT